MMPLKKIDIYLSAEHYESDFPYYFEISAENQLAGYTSGNTSLIYAGIRFKINK